MRELILKRIEQIRIMENGFSRTNMKWINPLSHGTIIQFADEINFEELDDVELLMLFERILNRYFKQS